MSSPWKRCISAPPRILLLIVCVLVLHGTPGHGEEPESDDLSDISAPLFWSPQADKKATQFYSPFFTKDIYSFEVSFGISLRMDYTADLYGPAGRSESVLTQFEYLRPSYYIGDIVTTLDEALYGYMLAPRVFVFVIGFD